MRLIRLVEIITYATPRIRRAHMSFEILFRYAPEAVPRGRIRKEMSSGTVSHGIVPCFTNENLSVEPDSVNRILAPMTGLRGGFNQASYVVPGSYQPGSIISDGEIGGQNSADEACLSG